MTLRPKIIKTAAAKKEIKKAKIRFISKTLLPSQTASDPRIELAVVVLFRCYDRIAL
jgi:hypothetical protein